MNTAYENLLSTLSDRSATAGIIGLGYVGLPLAVATARQGFSTIGFDIDPSKMEQINSGESYIDAVSREELSRLVSAGALTATNDLDRLGECDVVVICVPTPLSRHRDPDLSFIENTGKDIAKRLRTGQLVVLESTTYPGTTREILKPILESGGLVSGRDFFLGFSPEREDPGNASFETATIPKVVAGDGAYANELMIAFYGAVVDRVVPVSSPDVAEAVKITENVFRAVNIALVNELKLIYGAMGIDVWEVIRAAATKPFGYMPFYPGPGLGGHCIPIDPFYLTWRAREFEISTRFIELAGEINTAMPNHVVDVLARAIDERLNIAVSVAKVLIVGLSYKKNVNDTRESPTFRLISLLESRGATVSFHDPYVPTIPNTREHPEFSGRSSTAISSDSVRQFDAILIATDHDNIDYELIAGDAKLIVDTRNAMAQRGLRGSNVVQA